MINDATAGNNPLMASATTNGPSVFWSNRGDTNAGNLSRGLKVAPDGRIFAVQFGDRPYADTDFGTNLRQTFAASMSFNDGYSVPAVWTTAGQTNVIAAGRGGDVMAFDGTTGAQLWDYNSGKLTDADPTLDPTNGNIYVPMGQDSIVIVGLNESGNALWSSASMPVFVYQGTNNPQRAQSAGCLAVDGTTYYFQTVSQQGDGQLYAINTANGSIKWSYATASLGWEEQTSSPIITSNNVLVVGNNHGGTYFALRDDGTNATLLATLKVDAPGDARSSATLSADGLLYLPARRPWTKSNGDGDAPSLQSENLFNAFDLSSTTNLPPVIVAQTPSQGVRSE